MKCTRKVGILILNLMYKSPVLYRALSFIVAGRFPMFDNLEGSSFEVISFSILYRLMNPYL